MSAQAVRGTFVFFKGSAVGGTMPTDSLYLDAAGNACSSMVACAGLQNKTIEIRGATQANPVVVEATISENANDKASWFAVTGNITAPGLVTLQIGAGAPQPVFYEPEVTWLRIRAVNPQGPPGLFPAAIAATFAGVFEGERWDMRFKGAFPRDNAYKGV